MDGEIITLNTIRVEPNAPLDYTPGTEHHHPIMSTIMGQGGQLAREKEIDTSIKILQMM